MSAGVLEHLDALEPFLDVSILAGFSFGVDKANVLVSTASLLGHRVSRTGSDHEPEKIQAIDDFAPLAEQMQIRQFIGSTHWVRRYLPPIYAAAAKVLGEYMKPGVKLGLPGLGAYEPPTPGCKAFKAIKLMCRHAIHLSVLDEAGAIDGSRPLEQVADACGMAWGSTNLQMTPRSVRI